MDRIAYFADLSVKRACAFAAFGIGMTMLGLMFDFHLAVRTGAILFSIMLVVLLLCSCRRYPNGFRDTELWTLLERRHELAMPDDRAKKLIAGVMRDTYLRYARICATIAASLWFITVLSWGKRALTA